MAPVSAGLEPTDDVVNPTSSSSTTIAAIAANDDLERDVDVHVFGGADLERVADRYGELLATEES